MLTKIGFTVDGNAGVIDGRLRARQELTYEDHKIIAVFILIIDQDRKITDVTCNIEAIYNTRSGWEEFNAKVIPLLKNDCCNNLKGTILPPGQKKIID